MSKTFGVTTETFLVLAWAARQPGLRERLIQVHQQSRKSELALRSSLTGAIPFVFEDPVYGPAYQGLLLHRLAQVDWGFACWALEAYAGVHLKESDDPGTTGKGAQVSPQAGEETALLWQAITETDRLVERLRRQVRAVDGSVFRGAQLLRLHFLLHLPLLVRTNECPFFVHEMLIMSLERVNWRDLAARLLGVSFSGEQTPEDDAGSGEEDEALCAATLLELIAAAGANVGEYVLEPKLSRQMRDECAELAEMCGATLRELRRLWELERGETQAALTDQ